MKEVRFCLKVVYKRVEVLTSGQSIPVQNFVKYPPPPSPVCVVSLYLARSIPTYDGFYKKVAEYSLENTTFSEKENTLQCCSRISPLPFMLLFGRICLVFFFNH